LNKNEIISSGLLELYVLGKTTEEENTQILAWKKEYPEVADEIMAIENNLELFDIANAIKPSDKAKENLFKSIKFSNTAQNEDITQVDSVSYRKETPVVGMNIWKYFAAASVALLIGSSIFYYTKYQSLNNELTKATSELSKKDAEIAKLNNNLEVPLNTFSQAVVLKGTPTSPTSTAKIFWVRNSGDVYVEPSGLPEAPSGFQYQLWAIIDKKPVDAGMIDMKKSGQKYNIQKMKSFGKVEAFAITLERSGGSPTPTMEKLYVISTI
jgi:hypothetical protein